MIQYLKIEHCHEAVFGVIHRFLVNDEPAPSYESEENGMQEFDKVLKLVQGDDYYPTFFEKAAYIICSIAGSQYFSNGNKRLAVVTLVAFLTQNNVKVFVAEKGEYQKILSQSFPLYAWEDNEYIPNDHALFLYNLAIVIGDRTSWGFTGFVQLKENVSEIFRTIYKV